MTPDHPIPGRPPPGHLTLGQLRVFVAVAEHQHVTRAAAALGVAQSAASATVAALEGGRGVRLFQRVGRGIELTGAGRAFLGEARAVLAAAAAAERMLDELAGLRRGVLSVRASQTIASYWLPRHLVAFARAHPGVEVELGIGNTAQVAAAVHEGAAEIGFVEGVVEDPSLLGEVVARDRLVLVVGAGHPWARDGRVPDEGLAGTDWVLREPGSGTRSAFEAELARLGLGGRLRVVLELPSNEAVRAAVEAGAGATVISASVAAPGLETGLLRQVRLDLPDRAFAALHHRERRLGHAAAALLGAIRAGVPAGGVR